jgi:hypothetical protein
VTRSFIRTITTTPVTPLFCMLLTLYLFSSGAHFYSPDEIIVYATTQAISQNASLNIAFALPLIHQHGALLTIPDNVTTFYSKYGLLQPVLSIPVFLFALWMHVNTWMTVALLYSPVISSINACFVYLIARRLRLSPMVSAVLSLLYGTATLAWPYAKFFYELPTATLMLSASVYFLLDPTKALRSTLLSGLFATLSVFARITQVLVLPSLMAYVIFRPRDGSPRQRLTSIALFVLPIVGGAMLYAYLNLIRFGSILDFGYGGQGNVLSTSGYPTNPLVGMYGMLFSAGEGLFIYYPLCAVGFVALLTDKSNSKWTRFIFAWIFLANLIFYSRFNDWHGWGAWGARYLVVTVPYLMLGLGPFIESARKSITRMVIIVTAIAVGVFTNLMGVLINFLYTQGYLADIGAFDPSNFPYPGIWIPQFSQVRGSWDLLWSPTYPARIYPYVSGQPLLYMLTRLDLFFYVRFGTPALAITILLLFVEVYWLVRNLKEIKMKHTLTQVLPTS